MGQSLQSLKTQVYQGPRQSFNCMRDMCDVCFQLTLPFSEWYNEKNQWGRESHSPRVQASNPGTRLRLHSRPEALSPASRSSCALGAPHAALVRAAARWVGVRYCAGVPGSAPRSRAPPASAEPTSTPERAVPLSPSSARRTEVAAEAGES